jgi:hypothetical protein
VKCILFSAATGMKWIEVKMKELGVTSHTEYKICFMIDSGAMISVHSPKYGVIDVGCVNFVDTFIILHIVTLLFIG